MPRLGRLDRDLRRLRVANLTVRMSVSWRRKARRAAAKVSPVFRFMLIWLMPGIWISTGSSTVEMLTSGRLRSG